MNKWTALLTATSLTVATMATVQAETHQFAAITFGSATSDVEAKTSFSKRSDRTDASSQYSIAYGISDRNYRLYADVAYNNNKIANQTTLTFNADYTYPVIQKLNVFGGAAVGHATLEWDEDNLGNGDLGGTTDDSFVYGLKAGVNYQVIPKAQIEFGYRQLYSSLKSTEDTLSLDVQDTATTYIGLTYSF